MTIEHGVKILITGASASTDGMAQDADVEIQRTTSSTSSETVPNTTGFSTLITINAHGAGTEYTYTDLRPNDGTYRWYRTRHVLSTRNPSTFLAPVKGAKPSNQNVGNA